MIRTGVWGLSMWRGSGRARGIMPAKTVGSCITKASPRRVSDAVLTCYAWQEIDGGSR